MGTKAARWFRVSSDGQDERNQHKEVDDYCEVNGYEVTKTFTLHDVSASKGQHEPELTEMLADIESGAYSVVVVAHSSRLDRRDPDVAQLYHLLVRKAGGRIESVREPEFGKATLSGNVITLLAQYGNHEYSKTLSEHVRAAKKRIRTNGGFDGLPPFGMTTEGDKYNRRLVPTQLGRTWVPQMFARCIDGQSAGSIAAWLTAEGVPTAKGHGRTVWSPKTICQLLRNAAYAGRHRDKNGVTVHACEALVDADTFRRAGEALASRPKRGPQLASTAFLTGILVCDHCGGPMYRITTRTGQFYRCSADPKFGSARKSECRNMHPVTAVDERAMQILTGSYEPVTKRELIAGKNYDADVEQVNMSLRELPSRDLPEDEEDAERARLRAERRRLAALPAIPDRWEEVPTGETYGEMYERLSSNPAALRAALRGRIVFRVCKVSGFLPGEHAFTMAPQWSVAS